MSPKKKKIDVLLGADHGGVALKDELLPFLTELGVTWEDLGTFGPEAVDYPDLALQVARSIAAGEAPRGILVCGSGIGMAIAANRVPGVRAAVCNDLFSARVARAHNNANILALGGRMIGLGLAREIVTIFLKTPFEKGRHLRRIRKIEGGC
jgi:ribose 5-phosphate isomerase B